MSPIPAVITELIARFERNLPDYKAQGYHEARLRIEFLNPALELLAPDLAKRFWMTSAEA